MVIETAISLSSASIIGAVAEIAEPPQIEVPIPISALNFGSILNILLAKWLIESAVITTAVKIISTWPPTSPKILSDKVNPNKTMPVFKIYFDTKPVIFYLNK